MLWYNILNPRNWPGVTIQTGNNKIDGVYYNLLSSNHVSLAASGSIFLAANSGIRLISPSFVDASGLRAQTIFAENFGKINNSGSIIPLYSGSNSGLVYKTDDSNLSSTNYFIHDSGNIKFPSGSTKSPLYLENNTNKIITFSHLQFTPPSGIIEGSVVSNVPLYVNSGISIGPNNYLNSYKGYILTHAGSGEVAQWKPSTYLRENYDTSLPLDGLERVGASWIRYPRRPALLKNNKLYIYSENRPWTSYSAITTIEQIEQELGNGFDTLCVETVTGEVVVGYTKFAFVVKSPSQQNIEAEYVFEENVASDVLQNDPDDPESDPISCFELEIAPENPNGIGTDIPEGVNVLIFSVTKGGYLPFQLEPNATDNITYQNVLDETIETEFTFKPSTLNNLSIRPGIHTAFNMLGENIDFLVYGKKTIEFNNYDPNIFDLNENFIPGGLVPAFKIDANIINSVSGSPNGVLYSRYLDRNKTIPSGWGFDDKSKICINTSGSYVLGSIASGTGLLSTYADLTVNGHSYTTSLTTEDIFLKPVPSSDGSSKYVANALLTVDYNGKIISRTPKSNPSLPSKPLNVRGVVGHNTGGEGHYEHSIQWQAPNNDGNSTIIRYHIQFSLDNGTSWTTAQDTSENSAAYIDRGFISQTSCSIKTITNNVKFRVAAQNAIGIGPYSDPSDTFDPNLNVPTSPIALSGVRNIIDNISEINLSWDSSAQLGPGGSGSFSGYIIEESDDYGQTWYYYNMPSSSGSGNGFITTNSGLITGLDSNTDYLYRVSAWNNNGASSYSFIYFTGVSTGEIDPEEQEQENDMLGDWDFGVILFTGVCNT